MTIPLNFSWIFSSVNSCLNRKSVRAETERQSAGVPLTRLSAFSSSPKCKTEFSIYVVGRCAQSQHIYTLTAADSSAVPERKTRYTFHQKKSIFLLEKYCKRLKAKTFFLTSNLIYHILVERFVWSHKLLKAYQTHYCLYIFVETYVQNYLFTKRRLYV